LQESELFLKNIFAEFFNRERSVSKASWNKSHSGLFRGSNFLMKCATKMNQDLQRISPHTTLVPPAAQPKGQAARAPSKTFF
jgi:hypothetical protein